MSTNSKILELTAEIQRLLDEINGLVVSTEFKTPTLDSSPRTVKDALPPVESAAPDKPELEKEGIDFTKVDYLRYGTILKGKGRLEYDLWKRYDAVLFANGYKYNGDEKQWEFQTKDASQKPSQPQKAASTKDKATEVTRISGLTEDLKSPTVEGKLLDDPVQRDVNTQRGPTAVTSFRIDDGSAICRVSVWGELGDGAMALTEGDGVRITSVMVKPPYDGVAQVSTGKWSKITPL